MNITSYRYLLLFSLLLLSCDDEGGLLASIDGLTCNNPTQVIDDCGNCQDSATSDDWNNVMDDCGICFGNNSECTGCSDPIASNYDEEADFLDESCVYDPYIYFNYDENTDITINPNSKIVRPGTSVLFHNNLDINISLIFDDETLNIIANTHTFKTFNNVGGYLYFIDGHDIYGIINVESFE